MKLKNKHIYDDRTTKSMQTWIQLLRSYKVIHAKELSFITSCDLSMSQFEVLEALYHKGDLRVGELTKLIMSTAGNITVVLKNLKKNGFITVSPCVDDKRSSIIAITKLGEETIAGMFNQHADNLRDCFTEFDDEELALLFSLLRRLYKFNKKEK